MRFFKAIFVALITIVRKVFLRAKARSVNDKMEPLFVNGDGQGYYCGLYDEFNYKTRIEGDKKKEYIYGKGISAGINTRLEISRDGLLPVQVCGYINDINCWMSIKINGKNYIRKNQMGTGDRSEYRFDYLNVKKDDIIDITANKDYIIGDVIPNHQINRHKNRLVLLLVIDSLSQVVLDKYGIETIMPNTSSFFCDSIKMINNYCCADWTLPGMATIFTGKYPADHRLLHPRKVKSLEQEDLLTAFFKKQDYLVSFFNSDWRMAPEYGYIKNTDRSVYVGGSHTGSFLELFDNMLEQLRMFPDRDHFVVLSLYDLHHFMKDIQGLAPRTRETLDVLFYDDKFEGKSINRDVDNTKEKIYIEEIKELDSKLELLYLFLNDKYTKDNLSVVLCADHGVSYIDEVDDLLYEFNNKKRAGFKESMFKVPLMIKGPNFKPQVFNGYTDNRSIKKILRLIAEDKNMDNDTLFELSHQEYVYNECIYPNQSYKVKIIDSNNIFFYETKDECKDNCVVNDKDFCSLLYEKRGEIIEDQDVKAKYINIVREHLKEKSWVKTQNR